MASAGYNQSGGAYYLIISSVNTQVNYYTAGTGSGGATTAGSFAASSIGASQFGTALATGGLLKDMGKTVVSAGRTFRKFQAVMSDTAGFQSSLGVGGDAPEYNSAFFEIGREGQNGTAVLPAIARFA